MKKKYWLVLLAAVVLSSGAGSAAVPAAASQAVDAWQADYYVVVSAPDGGVNFRQGPGVEYSKLIDEMIPNGVVLHVIAEAQASNGNNWGYTDYNGQAGWIALTQVSRTEAPAEEETAAAQEGIVFEHFLDGGVERGTATKYDDAGGIVWQYTTDSYEAAQCDRVSEIGLNGELYYLLDGGAIVALDAETGEIAWKNDEFTGVGTEKGHAFGSDGTLYISGYLGPDLFIADKEGKTLYRKDMFDSSIVWPYEMVLEEENNVLKIHFENNDGSGDQWIQVNLDKLEYQTY